MKLKKLILSLVVTLSFISPSVYAYERSTYIAEKLQIGTSVTIPEARISELCGDVDGCKIRIALHDWDGTRTTASRETLFYYNSSNRNWRDSEGDTTGTSNNFGTQHIIQAWSCYFTDGKYENFIDLGDNSPDFALLSWTQYNADCRITIID